MLKYIITVTEDLLITVTLVTLLYTLCFKAFGRRGQITQIVGISTGVLASAAMAILKNLTKLIKTNQWNQWIFYLTVLFSVLFILFSLLFMRKKEGRWHAGSLIACACGACAAALLIFYELPDVMAYPFNFNTGDNGILSVEFLVRFLGWAFALILMLVYSRYLYKCAFQINGMGLPLLVLDLGLALNALRCLGQILRPWLSRAKWLHWPITYVRADYPWAFPFATFVANNTVLFSLIIAGLSLILLVLFYVYNMKIHGRYENSAQLRKLKARARSGRRISVTVLVCLALSALILTSVKAYANRAPILSAPETYTITAEDTVVIELDQVSDGTLHRFEYKTENNVNVRWIVIKKPGGSAFGVGLDACEVCGTAGYYQRGEQVVCKRCDVVMNINTIGFRGGCNPIPLAYEVKNGQMIFKMSDIIAAEKEFK